MGMVPTLRCHVYGSQILLMHKKQQRSTRLDRVVVVVVISHIKRIGYQPEKTTLHDGQSRSRSAEQVKENKQKKSGSIPPPTHTHTHTHNARSDKNK